MRLLGGTSMVADGFGGFDGFSRCHVFSVF
jgi:hypothetical protein